MSRKFESLVVLFWLLAVVLNIAFWGGIVGLLWWVYNHVICA